MITLIQLLAAGIADDSGDWLENGTVTSYEAGTTTLKPLYQDFETQLPYSNPATLDATGKLIAYANNRVKLVFHDADGNLVRTIDNIGVSDIDVAAAQVGNLAGNGLAVDVDGLLNVQVDGATLTILQNLLKIQNGGVGTDQLGDEAVTDEKLAEDIELTNLADDVDLPGTSVTAGSKKIVVSNSNPSAGLAIVRGFIDSSGNNPGSGSSYGEGFTVTVEGTGDRTVNFSNAFAAAPAIILSSGSGGAVSVILFGTPTTGSFRVTTSVSGSPNNQAISFLAIGIRAA